MARLRMTNADYVAIAVSPALVMALVGSLVFFLIEVLYVGGCCLRVHYVFALFVFATVLIARIAIELGSELAAMYSIPLGLLTYLALQRFIEHAGPLSWLINLLLLAVVWWCSHKLTWDCTVIDDNEDSSGEGLLGRVGVDASSDRGVDAPTVTDNELLADADPAASMPWWQRIFRTRKGPHTPGLWVLYFSLAALPLFGVGQHWIPASDVARRRYAFGLLAVYVAAALSLLVTTSFLGLRRYLRQRRVEMPGPMAVTWVSLGAVLILLVMFAAALIPRPKAEYAIAQVPWQAGSPGDRAANRVSVGNEGTVDESADSRVTSDNQDEAPPGNEVGPDGQAPLESDAGQQPAQGAEQSQPQASPPADQPAGGQSKSSGESPDGPSAGPPGDQSPQNGADGQQPGEQSGRPPASDASQQPANSQQQGDQPVPAGQGGEAPDGDDPRATERGSALRQMFEHSRDALPPPQIMQAVTSSVGNLLKLVFYALLALGIFYLAWRYRVEIARAIAEIIQQLRDFWARLFGRRPAALAGDEAAATAAPRRRTFAEYPDPFLTGRYQQLPPVELVRYTFEAFEAWAGDHDRPRTPDQTPQELLRGAVPPRSPMYEPASHLVRLYSEAAYASKPVAREATTQLRELWHMMQSSRQVS